MACDDILTALSALVVGRSAGEYFIVEVKACEKSLGTVLAYAAILGSSVAHLSDDILKFTLEPCRKFFAGLLLWSSTRSVSLSYKAAHTEEVDDVVVAHCTESASLKSHLGKLLIVANKAEEVVADSNVYIHTAVSTENVGITLTPSVGNDVENALISPNPLRLVGSELVEHEDSAGILACTAIETRNIGSSIRTVLT